MKNFTLVTFLLITTLCLSFNTKSEEANDEYCNSLSLRDAPDSHTELYAMAVTYASQTCVNIMDGFEGASYSTDFLLNGVDDKAFMRKFTQEITANFPESIFHGSKEFSNSWLVTPTASPLNIADFKALKLVRDSTAGFGSEIYTVDGRYGRNQLKLNENDAKQSAYCMEKHNLKCHEVLRQINASFFIYNHYLVEYTGDSIDATLRETIAQWDKYNGQAPSLSFVSTWATTRAHKTHFYGTSWPGPPPYQVRLLELSLVMDHSPTSMDGDKTNPGVALEWLGFNDWDNETLPWGMGLTSVYVDRENTKSLGLGLIFHIKNNYSFGVVKRGDDTTLFFNFALSDWFGEQKSKVSDYKSNLKEQFDAIKP